MVTRVPRELQTRTRRALEAGLLTSVTLSVQIPNGCVLSVDWPSDGDEWGSPTAWLVTDGITEPAENWRELLDAACGLPTSPGRRNLVRAATQPGRVTRQTPGSHRWVDELLGVEVTHKVTELLAAGWLTVSDHPKQPGWHTAAPTELGLAQIPPEENR